MYCVLPLFFLELRGEQTFFPMSHGAIADTITIIRPILLHRCSEEDSEDDGEDEEDSEADNEEEEATLL